MTRVAGDADPPVESLGQSHFDRLYADRPDPWGLATEWYEQRKYAITLASLPRQRYTKCYEPGCAIGELTRLLAPRCDRLLAVDFAAQAVESARHAVRAFEHVQVEVAALPRDLPDEHFDLIVVSEVLYYLSGSDLQATVDGLLARLEPGGDVVAVHHRASDRCYGYDGFNVHCLLRERSDLIEIVRHEDEAFVLDVFRKHVLD